MRRGGMSRGTQGGGGGTRGDDGGGGDGEKVRAQGGLEGGGAGLSFFSSVLRSSVSRRGFVFKCYWKFEDREREHKESILDPCSTKFIIQPVKLPRTKSCGPPGPCGDP